MAELSPDPERARRAAARSCGTCSHCCSVLRVDELAKPAGQDCRHQRGEQGCGIHAQRPAICRGYRCLWLQGGLEEDERPDRTGGIVDLESTGIGLRLGIREVRPGEFDRSLALQTIAARFRNQMPVRVTDADDVMNPDRPFRVLLAEGEEQRVRGERIDVFRSGVFIETRVLSWAERLGRKATIWWRSRTLQRIDRST
jgi:Fe-S-cluster containining protein